jgi:hypothetical protein
MAIQTIFIPITTKMTESDAFFLKSRGQMADFMNKATSEREAAESLLDQALATGWTTLHTATIEGSGSTVFAFVLHKKSE